MIAFKRSGFTLIEILIGMSLLSVMMLLLFASLRICVQNWNAGERKITQVGEAGTIQYFLQSKLHSTLPLEADFLEEQQFSFQGEAEQIQFVASMPASANRLGLQQFKMSLERAKNNQGSNLLVDIKPFFPLNENEEWSDEQVVILKNIKHLDFAYFGLDRFHNDPVWQDEWLEKHKLPKLVSIDIELTNGEVWPQIVVALNVNAVGRGASGGRNSFNIVDGKFAD